jgi:hypothetical protein
MEIIQEIIQESVSGGFFKFLGYWIMIVVILGIPANIIKYAINRPLRHMNIRKYGYPPSHCDADGDFLEKE